MLDPELENEKEWRRALWKRFDILEEKLEKQQKNVIKNQTTLTLIWAVLVGSISHMIRKYL